jgi:hypothetical protein
MSVDSINNGCSILWDWDTRCRVEVLAAEKGHLDFLKLLSDHFRTSIYIDTICVASEYGHLHIVQWAYDNKFVSDICKQEVIHAASRYGHIHILKWGYDNWDHSIFQLIGIFDGARGAAIKWLHDKDLIDDTKLQKCLMHEYFCLMMNR